MPRSKRKTKAPKVSRARMELARDKAMLNALFFWQVGDRMVNLTNRGFWETKAIGAMNAAIRLDQALLGYTLPWEDDDAS